MEEWRTITRFPLYEISSHGRIRKKSNSRPLAYMINMYNVVCVGLMRDHVQYKRSVALLIATAFIPRPFPAFDTPIHLNGDRSDNHVENLIWRPRWFAVKYNRQFRYPYAHPLRGPIEDMGTGLTYDSSFEIAKTFGLLEEDVVLSILNHTVTWPTYQTFRIF